MTIEHKIIAWGGWQQCVHITNGIVKLIVPLEIGIRVMHYGFVGGANQFCELPDQMGKTNSAEWVSYGGHRLWHAPETRERTYSLDNFPIHFERHGDTFTFTQPTDHADMRKQIEITLSADSSEVRVLHRITNQGVWAVEASVWALSVMANGGKAIIPLPPRGNHETDLLPNTRLTLWSYTNMADPRWTWGEKYILLQQDAEAMIPQKIGLANPLGWAAHWNDGTLFASKTTYQPNATYPDHGCSNEFFTNFAILEVESLAPLVTLQPNESATHLETWQLWDGVPEPKNDGDVEAFVRGKVEG